MVNNSPTSPHSISEECNYSFSNLFFAAFDRYQTSEEMAQFVSLDQDNKNKKVIEWAAKVHWQTQEKMGTDGKTYIAFALSFS